MKQLQSDIFQLLSSSQRPVRLLQRYDQKETPYCIYYAFAGMLAWNTGDIMEDKNIRTLGDKLKVGKLHARMPKLIELLTSFYNTYILKEDWSAVIDKDWAIQVYLRPTREFWIDAIDGDLDKYHLPGDGLDHSAYIHKEGEKILLENSWKGIPTIDITGKLVRLRKEGVIPGAGYVFTRKD